MRLFRTFVVKFLEIGLKLGHFQWIVTEDNNPGFRVYGILFEYYKWKDTVIIEPWGIEDNKTDGPIKWREADKRELSRAICYEPDPMIDFKKAMNYCLNGIDEMKDLLTKKELIVSHVASHINLNDGNIRSSIIGILTSEGYAIKSYEDPSYGWTLEISWK